MKRLRIWYSLWHVQLHLTHRAHRTHNGSLHEQPAVPWPSPRSSFCAIPWPGSWLCSWLLLDGIPGVPTPTLTSIAASIPTTPMPTAGVLVRLDGTWWPRWVSPGP
eukprot:CAMPEP_0119487184 /NCGR_PEP_ID=MMETSP1344-20130328/13346_1 /TAXON_ID=236787 /ORGANISM="Florenciella parvula, Strain CCMP2471" /LENGTH=105 /DNA_ID=CAMNT_0007522017 /DNA_START=183 /DNA_END=496 /DNA_ORIENTATION=-